jgi:hypothetical protein
VKAEVEYAAFVTVRVDLEAGEVASADIRSTRVDGEPAEEVRVMSRDRRTSRTKCSTARTSSSMLQLPSS